MPEEQLRLRLKSIDFSTLRFAPKKDISVFELAQALMVLLPCGGPLLTAEQAFGRLGPEVRRHFTFKMVSR